MATTAAAAERNTLDFETGTLKCRTLNERTETECQ